MLEVSNSNVTMKFVKLHYFLSQNIGETNDIMSPCPKVGEDKFPRTPLNSVPDYEVNTNVFFLTHSDNNCVSQKILEMRLRKYLQLRQVLNRIAVEKPWTILWSHSFCLFSLFHETSQKPKLPILHNSVTQLMDGSISHNLETRQPFVKLLTASGKRKPCDDLVHSCVDWYERGNVTHHIFN